VSGQVVDQVLLAQAMNQERTSPPASCKVHHHHTCAFYDLVELVHEQKGMLDKQDNEIKELNALNDLSATFATNYEHLLCKFKLLSKESDELKSKLESNETMRTMCGSRTGGWSLPCVMSD
jgi:hypothetical protein